MLKKELEEQLASLAVTVRDQEDEIAALRREAKKAKESEAKAYGDFRDGRRAIAKAESVIEAVLAMKYPPPSRILKPDEEIPHSEERELLRHLLDLFCEPRKQDIGALLSRY